jgi:hypothetical protein
VVAVAVPALTCGGFGGVDTVGGVGGVGGAQRGVSSGSISARH